VQQKCLRHSASFPLREGCLGWRRVVIVGDCCPHHCFRWPYRRVFWRQVTVVGANSSKLMMARSKDSPINELPEGFLYQPEFLSGAEEAELLHAIQTLPFTSFEFGEYTAKRRIVVYGWDYDFGSRHASETDPIPEWLWPLRARAAEFASVASEDLVEAVVTEYPSGAPIGWHRDVPQFGDVVGISLLSDCRMRFKPREAEGKPVSITLEPRSVYLLRGPVRWMFQHSIAAVKSLRYSITFRTLRNGRVKKIA